jgi:K+-transporting ATPase ATPase B chain
VVPTFEDLAVSQAIIRKLLPDGTIQEVSSTALRRGDQVKVIAGDMIPAGGEVIKGVASVDESAKKLL